MPAVPFRYALITPARNEAAFIEQTIQSVIAQRLKPIKWLIASDGSTDGTDQIVQKYLTGHPWLELMRMPEHAERTFAGKARAFNTGYAAIKSFEFDVIGNLDADITIQDPEYFAFLMGKFAENPKLGVAGTPFVENNETYNFRYASVEHVSGACQLFRRQCLEAIGGYQFLKAGGVDFVAVLSARMHGWQTRSFLEKACFHHRKQGGASRRGLKARLYVGRQGRPGRSSRLGAFPRHQSHGKAATVGRRGLHALRLLLAMAAAQTEGRDEGNGRLPAEGPDAAVARHHPPRLQTAGPGADRPIGMIIINADDLGRSRKDTDAASPPTGREGSPPPQPWCSLKTRKGRPGWPGRRDWTWDCT